MAVGSQYRASTPMQVTSTETGISNLIPANRGVFEQQAKNLRYSISNEIFRLLGTEGMPPGMPGGQRAYLAQHPVYGQITSLPPPPTTAQREAAIRMTLDNIEQIQREGFQGWNPLHVPTIELADKNTMRRMRDVDRLTGIVPHLGYVPAVGGGEEAARTIAWIMNQTIKGGVHDPPSMSFNPLLNAAATIEGNHRLAALDYMGFPFIPATAIVDPARKYPPVSGRVAERASWLPGLERYANMATNPRFRTIPPVEIPHLPVRTVAPSRIGIPTIPLEKARRGVVPMLLMALLLGGMGKLLNPGARNEEG